MSNNKTLKENCQLYIEGEIKKKSPVPIFALCIPYFSLVMNYESFFILASLVLFVFFTYTILAFLCPINKEYASSVIDKEKLIDSLLNEKNKEAGEKLLDVKNELKESISVCDTLMNKVYFLYSLLCIIALTSFFVFELQQFKEATVLSLAFSLICFFVLISSTSGSNKMLEELLAKTKSNNEQELIKQ